MTDPRRPMNEENRLERKTRVLILGVGFGAIVGLISSYLYTRAAEENDNSDSAAPRTVSTGQLLAILLAILGVVRQVAELGKPKKPGKK
ncbi:MAG: hypothetical protein OXT68_15790 [Chloroflexota bacterium]|nr:hypothetical protein [Chloroflexota bacterium]